MACRSPSCGHFWSSKAFLCCCFKQNTSLKLKESLFTFQNRDPESWPDGGVSSNLLPDWRSRVSRQQMSGDPLRRCLSTVTVLGVEPGRKGEKANSSLVFLAPSQQKTAWVSELEKQICILILAVALISWGTLDINYPPGTSISPVLMKEIWHFFLVPC